ncbi:unnamed protein product [Protopolystoma xenopodis]|uniref:Uncharacterized protein n=1 Tax=Protopolystoma xenopodis TaxID=117903 RepID=A0A3S5APG1_9PLAT|nr:unnamed protein product [Protopolystoma xenopodis]
MSPSFGDVHHMTNEGLDVFARKVGGFLANWQLGRPPPLGLDASGDSSVSTNLIGSVGSSVSTELSLTGNRVPLVLAETGQLLASLVIGAQAAGTARRCSRAAAGLAMHRLLGVVYAYIQTVEVKIYTFLLSSKRSILLRRVNFFFI